MTRSLHILRSLKFAMYPCSLRLVFLCTSSTRTVVFGVLSVCHFCLSVDTNHIISFLLDKRPFPAKIQLQDLILNPFCSQECQQSKFNNNDPKFHFVKYWKKLMVPCKSTAQEVSFEWSHHRISSPDSKLELQELHYMSPLLIVGVKLLI